MRAVFDELTRDPITRFAQMYAQAHDQAQQDHGRFMSTDVDRMVEPLLDMVDRSDASEELKADLRRAAEQTRLDMRRVLSEQDKLSFPQPRRLEDPGE